MMMILLFCILLIGVRSNGKMEKLVKLPSVSPVLQIPVLSSPPEQDVEIMDFYVPSHPQEGNAKVSVT